MNWRIPETKNDFISGYFYYRSCDWSFCPRYVLNFDVSKIKENDTVFLNLDYFENFLNILKLNNNIPKFILVTQNSDRDFTEMMFNLIGNYTNKILAINSTFSNEKVEKIPLGFNDHSTEILDNEIFDFVKKKNLVYINFKLHHHPDRKTCFNYFSTLDWVDIENGSTTTNPLSLDDFYKKLKTYKYCISPRGTGIDTHRLYESLLYGVIPIVVKSDLDDLYSKFPILLVEKWEDVTFDFLQDEYETNLAKYLDWYKKNPNWYKSDFWIKK
jgi:hypothetical protein